MSASWARWDGADLIVSARVQPRARRDAVEADTERLRIRITAPPVDGAANAYLRSFVARCFDVPTGGVALIRGDSSRDKVLRIAAPRKIPDELASLLERA